MADQMTPAELRAAADPNAPIESWTLDYLADAARRLADVIELAEGYYGGENIGEWRVDCDAGEVWRIARGVPADALREVKAEAIREYVTAARENPHTYYWPPSGVLDDAEQWADEIEKGMI